MTETNNRNDCKDRAEAFADKVFALAVEEGLTIGEFDKLINIMRWKYETAYEIYRDSRMKDGGEGDV